MKVYRIAKQQYLEDLTGEGARLYGGRWNKKGMAMLYFSESLSLALLEILVHTDFQYLTSDFGYLEVEIPDEYINSVIKLKQLKPSWRDNPPKLYTQDLGSEWLKKNKDLAMKVPSAILPFSSNILVNPRHTKISEIKIIKKSTLDVDNRVFDRKN